MLKLKEALTAVSKTQRDLAQHLGISPAGVAQICNHGIFPKKPDIESVQSGILRFLEQHGASVEVCRRAFDVVPVNLVVGHPEDQQPKQPQEEIMLIAKQTLTQQAKEHFKLKRDPFTNDVLSHEDVFLSGDIRYVRETLWQVAKHGGFVAVTGESGAGKTTLLCDLHERIATEHKQIVVIAPYVLGMEDNDVKGKTLKALHIAESIISKITPLQKPKRSPEARFNQVHDALRNGARAGMTYVLIIEEAHSLPIPTLKHLKRLIELKDGFKNLIGVVLLGQSELRMKLSEHNPDVREVVQRCEVVELTPLDNDLEAYIKFKLARVDKQLADVIDPSGIEGLRNKLTFKHGGGKAVSLLYPLAVANLLTASMNLAATLGFLKVTADTVKEA